MDLESKHFACLECGESLEIEELGKADNPFNDSDPLLCCPCCNAVVSESFSYLLFGEICDIKGCKERATCGTPFLDTYVRCCGKHYAEIKDSREGEE